MDKTSASAPDAKDSHPKVGLAEVLRNPVLSGAAVFGICALLLFYDTVASMVAIWYRSETFLHGFLIAPIVIWLIWNRRQALLAASPGRPAYWILVPLLGAQLLWMFAYAVDVQVVQQLAFIAVLILGIWLILGSAVAWQIAFPLAYLFLAVPIGEGLIPPLMEFTADFTVGLVRLFGIPVYREGLFFTLPSGAWSVVEGCSGVRYLIASFTLGCLYAYLTYQRIHKRVIFMVASLLVPILANGLRAFMIVMIGHFSSMKLATGVDHLVYGWVFFGLVMLVLFSIGAIWRDPEPQPHHSMGDAGGVQGRRSLTAVVIALLIAAMAPAAAYWLDHQPSSQLKGDLQGPLKGGNDWRLSGDALWRWGPVVNGPDAELKAFYRSAAGDVGVYLGLYLDQNQDKELINSQNVLAVQKSPDWRVTARGSARIRVGETWVEVDSAEVKGVDTHLYVLRFYRLGERYTANPYLGKILGGLGRLGMQREDAAYITLATPVDELGEQPLALLQNWVDGVWPQLERALNAAAGQCRKLIQLPWWPTLFTHWVREGWKTAWLILLIAVHGGGIVT